MKSIRPQHVCNILNWLKKLEISTTAPKDWKDYLSGKTDKKPEPIDVLIYVTKEKGTYLYGDKSVFEGKREWFWCQKRIGNGIVPLLNGKVVAKFTLKDVEVIKCIPNTYQYETQSRNMVSLVEDACLDAGTLDNYLKRKLGYAWHIDNLVIFDKPKEIAMCTHDNNATFYTKRWDKAFKRWRIGALIRAPQSWCYVEV